MRRKSIVIVSSVVTLLLFASMGFCGTIDGKYRYDDKYMSGFLTVESQGANKVKFSFENSNIQGHLGLLEFVTTVDASGNAQYSNKNEYDDCQINLNIKRKVIKVNQIKGQCDAGLNVNYNGSYKKIK